MARNSEPLPEINPPRGNGAAPAPGENAAFAEADFDLAKYAYQPPSGGPVRREQLTIPEGRPKDSFFRIDPREHMQLPVSILEFKPEGRLSPDVYILTPEVAEQLGRRSKHAVIRVCICRPSILRLWAVKVPLTDRGTPNSFTQSAWDAVDVLEREWGRLDMNESGTGWDVAAPVTQWPDPEWRDDSLAALIHKAFKGRFVDSMDHDILKTLRGED